MICQIAGERFLTEQRLPSSRDELDWGDVRSAWRTHDNAIDVISGDKFGHRGNSDCPTAFRCRRSETGIKICDGDKSRAFDPVRKCLGVNLADPP
jgi:hypothetical protein